MTKQEMLQRTKSFALQVVKTVLALPRLDTAGNLGKQLLRSGTSVGANYRAACRARSTADFVAKLKIVEEECDESIYWMELLVDAGLFPLRYLDGLLREANEILSMIVAALRTLRLRHQS